ncbi:MAG: hypothetical protein E7425_10810, partial [Ruminococcaceae bacterium]|nr:hypothetical protein [Oscillospiraceae bacterium]
MAGRRLAWAAWFLAAALLWLFENGAATLTMLLASVLLPALSILAARRRAKRVRLSLAVPPRCAKGGALRVALAAEASGVLSRTAGRLRCEDALTNERAEAAFSFSPRLSGIPETSLAVETPHCGTLRLDAEAWTEDLFGLWRFPAPACSTEYVTVEPELFLPAVRLTENTTVVAEGERYAQTKPGSDPSET